MNALIVEDEPIASKRLANLVRELAPEIHIVDTIASVEGGQRWFASNPLPDLVFLDIQLNDGYGFDILDALETHPPVIFTTAYNEYAIRGFKYNGLDYLLKPIDKKELKRALDKFIQSPYHTTDTVEPKIQELKELFRKEYKHRFIVKVGNHFSTFNVSDIAYFKSDDGAIYLCTNEGKEYPIEYSLDQLEDILNPVDFFRINRQYVVALRSVNEIHQYFNSRLLLKLHPAQDEPVIVARERCTSFKKWLDM